MTKHFLDALIFGLSSHKHSCFIEDADSCERRAINDSAKISVHMVRTSREESIVWAAIKERVSSGERSTLRKAGERGNWNLVRVGAVPTLIPTPTSNSPSPSPA